MALLVVTEALFQAYPLELGLLCVQLATQELAV